MTLEEIRGRCYIDAGCWVWRGSAGNGYPAMRIGDKVVNVRREVARLSNKRMHKGCIVRCKCDEQLCVNPDHIYVSTRAKVIDELIEHGKIGTLSARIKLAVYRRAQHSKIGSMEIARQIRESCDSSRVEAKKHGVSPRTIQRIRSNEAWIDYANPMMRMMR